MNHVPLFENQRLRFTPVDPEKDARITAAWTMDLEIAARLRDNKPARPMAVFEVKKMYEQLQKSAEESNRQLLFGIRRRDSAAEEQELLGVLRFTYIEWVHGAAYMDLLIGSGEHWQQHAGEALEMALRYAFDELGLFRLTVVVAGHNDKAAHLLDQAGFTLEVRQPRAVYWNQQNWDKLYYGMLRPEWKLQQAGELVR